jgi:hypothetical protein
MKLFLSKRLATGLAIGAFLLGITTLAQAANPPAAPAKAAPAAAPKKAVLGSDDCVKCHSKEPADVAAAGGKHVDVTCTGCHEKHRPVSKNNIPQCGTCHEGKPHYTNLKGQCLKCHKNPHQPTNISMTGNLTDPCLTCHTQQIKQLKENKSKHTALFCTTCHAVHRKIPQCIQCHKPHSATMVQADCKKCHKAHQPAIVTYGSDLPSKDCGACHKKALDLLAASATKHKTLACVYCHQGKHKMVPTCQSCHGTPHPAGMLAKFPKCGDCHNIAHDLNRWDTAPKATAAPAKAPAGKKKR